MGSVMIIGDPVIGRWRLFLRELLVFLDLKVFRTQSSALNRFFSCSKQGPDPHDLEYFSSVFKAFMVE